MGLVISTFGDKLQRELPMCLPLLVDRMGNEITRLTAVKVVLIDSLKVFHFIWWAICIREFLLGLLDLLVDVWFTHDF